MRGFNGCSMGWDGRIGSFDVMDCTALHCTGRDNGNARDHNIMMSWTSLLHDTST